jgi:hypothetical protein
MDQAAMDVLMNKARWGDASTDRRSVWQPTAISTGERGDHIIRQGSPARITMLVLDEFDVYPCIIGLTQGLAI